MLELHLKGRDWAAHGVSLGLFLMKRVPNLSRNFWAAVETLPYSGGPLSLKTFSKGFSSRWLSSKESASNAEDLGLIPEWEDPLEKGMATHSSILAGESHGQRSLVGSDCSRWGHKESDVTEREHLYNSTATQKG